MFKTILFSLIALLGMSFTSYAYGQSAPEIVWKNYDHIDPFHLVPDAPLKKAIQYFDRYKDRIPNRDYLTIVDFTPKSTAKRFYLIDMRSGKVESYLVAHGEGSDPQKTGYTSLFSNIENSFMSSLGFYITTKDVFDGKNGISLRLKGIEKTNDQAMKRAILVHGGDYVKNGLNPLGWSQGCFVLDHQYAGDVINKIAGGSIIYAWIDPQLLGEKVNGVQTIIR
ncbi:MAG: hypothetical protein BroJett040_00230 [Oligoflexia bacterium]|nr:MAG: hypothetical protein BroJett040_00230 [Oligoflexia bacterium]